tara:strand:+ start:4786 stop:6852 length:2067 start_codon:yes stop_codon:yes gene_type:complete
MAKYKGTIVAGIQPYGDSSSNLANMSYGWRANYLKSAHTQMRYQVIWNGLNDNQAPSASGFNASNNKGEIVNIVFRVYATTQYPYPASASSWDLIATIKKSRDLANKSYLAGQPSLPNQRFTIDISALCQDLLSYSLVPINKGTWQSSYWGGMNGGTTVQDNVTETISNYNINPNGTYRHILVQAIPEVILANGTIQEATGQASLSFNKIAVINSVAQFEKDAIYYNLKYIVQKALSNTNNPKGFMSLCPNFTQLTSVPFLKQVRTDEEAEWLYWWQRNMGEAGDQTTKARLKVETYLSNGSLQNTIYLSDFNSNLDKQTVSNLEVFKINQERICVQNVSPVYINANAQDDGGNTITNKIDSSTSYYRTHLEYINAEDNLVENGDFANGATSWNSNANWTITTGEATSSGAAADINQGTWNPLSGHEYMVTFTIKSISSGGFRFQLGGVFGTTRTTTGTFTETITTTSTDRIRIFSVTSANGVVTDIQVQKNPTTIRATEYRYFGIDRETANVPFGFVRFHWLNRIGGIDSYTAKRNVTESLSVKKSTIETKSADRTWYQDDQLAGGTSVNNDNYISNTMRGGNLYKGGREVLNVTAQRNNSVFTEPLNKETADWLEEIITSPNVWIEMDTDATARGNTVNPFQRPSTKEYIPVIITNNEVEILNQESGLVKFNLEYTLSHKVQTQRN